MKFGQEFDSPLLHQIEFLRTKQLVRFIMKKSNMQYIDNMIYL